MNAFLRISGRLRQWKGRLQMWIGSLFANRTLYRRGEQDCFWGRIEKHAGKTEEEIRRFFRENQYEPPKHKPLF